MLLDDRTATKKPFNSNRFRAQFFSEAIERKKSAPEREARERESKRHIPPPIKSAPEDAPVSLPGNTAVIEASPPIQRGGAML
jgi:hypothetical protein